MMGRTGYVAIGAAVLALATGPAASADPVPAALCGTAGNSAICFASIDRAGKLSPGDRAALAAAAPIAIDIVSSPGFATELAAFHARIPADWRARNPHWRDFDPQAAATATRAAFAGLHINTVGSLRARMSAAIAGNLAYEGTTNDRTGERNIRLNRFVLDRPTRSLVATYVHEAAHKAGYSHRKPQTPEQKCEPPYAMGQLARKLADPDRWPTFAASDDACRFWTQSTA